MHRRLPFLFALLITAYAVVLRLDAYTTKHGPLTSPAWARILTTQGAAVGHALRPYEYAWAPVPTPYVGGDPANYLRFAREMRSFYQAHVREPLFLAITRGYLELLGDQDAGVSFASATGSVLAVLGTFMLATQLMPRWLALVPALLLAIDYEVVTWAVDGWRDDLFMATVVWTAWALLRVRSHPSGGNALLLGVLAAAACLTRITAVTFVLPALVWLVLDAPAPERPARVRSGAIALAALTVLVAPFLINCAIATGDPLFAINYHTVYYRHGEGESIEQSVGAADYVRSRFAQRPVRMIDIGLNGMFVHPLADKWSGFDPIVGRVRPFAVASAVMGLVLLLWNPNGRLLIVVLFSSLLPYAFTWHIGDGRAFRFTMHAYPIYLIAVMYLLVVVSRVAAATARQKRMPRPQPRAIALAIVIALLVPTAAWAYRSLPWLVVREAVAQGEAVSIESDARHSVFWTSGWSDPYPDGVMVRISTAERPRIALPLPSQREYNLVLRVDPVAPTMNQRLNVLFNGQLIGRLTLVHDPARVGSYRVHLPAEYFRAGDNQLMLIPEPTVTAASAGPRFALLPPETPIGIRLWHVRILGPND